MNEVTHTPVAKKEIQTKNRLGKEVVFQYTYYARTPQFEEKIRTEELGEFFRITPFQKTGNWINDKRFIAIVPTLHEARKIIATKVKKDPTRFRAVSGGDLINDYLDDIESKKVREGYPREEQFFILFGYGEALNKALPGVISQIITQRIRRNQHIWVLIPQSLSLMASEWKDYGGRAIRALDANIKVVQFSSSDFE